MKTKAAAYFVTSTLIAASNIASAGDIHFEAGAGQTKYGVQPDNTWYQRGMPHHLSTIGTSYTFGLTGSAIQRDQWGVDWHADYVNLGPIASYCRCTTIDADYSATMHRLVRSPTPTAEYAGHGHAEGIKLSLAPYVRLGKWDFGFEAGIFPYRPDFHLTVYGWSNTLTGPYVSGHHDTPHTWQLGSEYGLFVRHNQFTLSYEFYRIPTRYKTFDNPALWTGAHVLMLTYEFH